MKVQRPSGSTPNRPSAVESSSRWSDSWRCRTSSSVAAWRRALRRTIQKPVTASRAASTLLTTSSRRCVCRDASPSCAENLLSSSVSRLFRTIACSRISAAPGGVEIAADDALVRLLGERAHLLDDEIAFGPGDDRLGHEGNAMEPAEQPDQAADVVGMVAALQEAAPRQRQVGLGLLQLLAGDAIAERHRQRAEEAQVVVLAVVQRVVEEVDLRVLLPLRVEALAGDVGAHGGQQVDARHRDDQLQRDDARRTASPPATNGAAAARPRRSGAPRRRGC